MMAEMYILGMSIKRKTNNKQEYIVCQLIIGTMKKDKMGRERGERACDVNVGCNFIRVIRKAILQR